MRIRKKIYAIEKMMKGSIMTEDNLIESFEKVVEDGAKCV